MTMTEITRNAVEVAFGAAGDFVQSVTWRKQTFGAYDPTLGTRAIVAADTPVRAIEDKVTAGDMARLSLSSKSVKLVVPAVDFENASIEPAYEDKLVHRSITYTAKEAKFAGTKAVFEIFADV